MRSRLLLNHLQAPRPACRRQVGAWLHTVAIHAASSEAGQKVSAPALQNRHPRRDRMQSHDVWREAPARARIDLVLDSQAAAGEGIQPPLMILQALFDGVQRRNRARSEGVDLAEDPLRVPAQEPSRDSLDQADGAAPAGNAGVDGRVDRELGGVTEREHKLGDGVSGYCLQEISRVHPFPTLSGNLGTDLLLERAYVNVRADTGEQCITNHPCWNDRHPGWHLHTSSSIRHRPAAMSCGFEPSSESVSPHCGSLASCRDLDRAHPWLVLQF